MDIDDLHFTYNSDFDNTSLKQGDVLKKTAELEKLLEKYHSHYVSPEYTHFQILTQSCDLVMRGKRCSAHYITIAAVRSLDTVIQRTINSNIKNFELDGKLFCNAKNKERLASSLKKILNNNSKEYFYLNASPESNFENDSATFLHLSIAIRANEHYNLCLKAKTLELKENFRAKLGWMVGNLYSRVGTKDFVPEIMATDAEFEIHIQEVLNKHAAWLPASTYSEFKKIAENNTELEIKEILSRAREKIAEKKAKKLEGYVSQLKGEANLSPKQTESIIKYLNSERGSRYFS